MNNVDTILEKVKKINIYPQVVIDSIMECDASIETMQILADIDGRNELVEKAGSLIVAVNLAQTLAIEPAEFEELIGKVTAASEDEHIHKLQSSLFARLEQIAEGEFISKGVMPSVLQHRMNLIRSAIH